MKKKVLFFALLAGLLLPWSANAQVTCESGSVVTVSNADTSTGTTGYFPGYSLYNYSYTEQIILSEDLIGIGDIRALMFYATDVTSNTYFSNCEIYMANTSATSLSSGFIQDTTLFELVYSGSLNWTAIGWQTIVFDDPFVWDGSSNLLIAIRRNHGSWSSTSYFASYTASTSLAREIHRDDGPYIIGEISGGTAYSNVAWYRLVGCEGSGDYCFRVKNLTVSGITYDEVTLNWVDTNNASATYTIYNMSDSTVVGTATGTSYTVTGLNSNTLYTFGVQADCGSTTATFATISVRTACNGSTSVPYSTGFEDLATGDMPNCWLRVMSGNSGSGTFPSAYVYGTNAHSSNVYFEFESTSGVTEVAALPVMDNISSLKLAFWASMSSSYPCTLEVGVMEDTLFVPVDTVNLTTFSGTGAWSSNYHQYSVFFNGYTGSGDRIAMRATGTAGTQYTLMLDDFEVSVADAPEVQLPATAVTDINTDLVITATVGGDMTSMNYSWNSTMYNAGAATMSNVDNVLTINYSASGIDTVTIVVSNSYGDDTASMTVRAIDLDPIDEFPYNTGFESGEDINWQFVNGTNNEWVIGSAVNNADTGSHAMYISNDGGTSNSYSTSSICMSYAYRSLQIDEPGEFAIAFDWRAYGENSYDYLRAWVAPATFEFTANQLPDGTTSSINYQNSTPSGWIDLGGKMNYLNGWQHRQTTFTVTAAGTYNLVFMWANDGSSGTQPPAAVDNIYINQLVCPAVTDLTLDSITSSEMAFHWTPVGDESSWRVVIGDTIDVEVFDTNYSVTELSANTPYTVSVYALCGASDTSFATTATYRTACGDITVLPWSEDFESHTNNVAPTCWSVLGGNPRTYNSVPHSGSKHLYFSGSTSNMIALPPFEAQLNTLQVRFWTRPESYTSNYCGTFSVGYMTDASDASTFVALQTYSYSDFSDYEEKEVPLANAPDSAVVIAFRHQPTSSAWYWYVDDVTVEPIPACMHPVAVSAVATGDDELQVTVTGADTLATDDYRIYWTDGTTVDSADVTSTSYTITGLTPSTNYTVTVATICDDGSVSSSVSTTVRTQCAGGGCTIDIVMTDGFGDGWNGASINGYSGSNQLFSATLNDNSSGLYSFDICNGDTVSLTWTSGMYDDEIEFDILVGGDTIVSAFGDDYDNGDIIASAVYCASCSRPSGLVVTGTSDTTISVSFAGVDGDDYRLYIVSGTTVVDSADVTTTTYTFAGLNPSTAYTVLVVKICDDGSLSTPTSVTARTECAGGGCDIEINMDDSFGDGWNGNAINGYVNGALTFTATLATGYSGVYTYSMCDGDSVVLNWVTGSYTSETSFIVSVGGEPIVNASGSNYSDGGLVTSFVGCPTCPRPTDLVVVSTDEHTATISWTAGGSETEWQVSLDGGAPVTVYSTTYTFTGLSASTTYGVSIQAVCGGSDVSYSLDGGFATSCGIIGVLPWTEDFNSTPATSYSTAGEMPNCWLAYSNGTSSAYTPHVVAYGGSYAYSNDNTNSLIMTSGSSTYGDTKIVVLPEFSTPLNGLTLSFWMGTESSTYGTLYIGYMAGTDLANDFIAYDSIPASSTTSSTGGFYDTVSFASAPATNARIALRWNHYSSYYSVCIDNITVSGASTVCDAPVINNVTATESEVSFSIVSVADSNEVVIMAGSWVEPANGGTLITTASHTFSGLEPNTQYTVGVRAVCAEGFYSAWTYQSVTTADHPCDMAVNVTVSDVTYDGATVNWAAGGSESQWLVRVSSTSPVSEVTYFAENTPAYVLTDLVPGVTYQVIIRSACSSTQYSDWTAPVSFTTPTCTVPTGVTSSAITATSATISWTSTGATRYEVEYGTMGYVVGGGSIVPVENATTITLTGLEEQTAYDVYVRGYCTESIVSEWSAKHQFTTPAAQNGIDNVDASHVMLYPNPASSTVTLTGIEGEATVTVVDMNGRTVASYDVRNSELRIDVSGYAKGAYFVRVTGEQTTAIRKLVVK